MTDSPQAEPIAVEAFAAGRDPRTGLRRYRLVTLAEVRQEIERTKARRAEALAKLELAAMATQGRA